MIEVSMGLYAGAGQNGTEIKNSVTLNAKFANAEDAVRFHTGLAELCKEHSTGAKSSYLAPWIARRIAPE